MIITDQAAYSDQVRVLRPGLRPVLAAGLPIQPTPRRAARPALLVLHPRRRLRRAAWPRAQPHQHPADPRALGLPPRAARTPARSSPTWSPPPRGSRADRARRARRPRRRRPRRLRRRAWRGALGANCTYATGIRRSTVAPRRGLSRRGVRSPQAGHPKRQTRERLGCAATDRVAGLLLIGAERAYAGSRSAHRVSGPRPGG